MYTYFFTCKVKVKLLMPKKYYTIFVLRNLKFSKYNMNKLYIFKPNFRLLIWPSVCNCPFATLQAQHTIVVFPQVHNKI